MITGAGTAFCCGGDVKAIRRPARPDELRRAPGDLRWRQSNLTGALFAVRKPTIAALPGAAAGAGLAVALACDMRIAAKSAFAATGYARIGLSGDYGMAWLLTRTVGPMRARELMLTAERVDVDRDERIGLVNRVVDDAMLQKEAFAWAKSLAEGPQIAFRHMKDNLDEALGIDYPTALFREAERLVHSSRTQDQKEGMAAFVEKRKFKAVGHDPAGCHPERSEGPSASTGVLAILFFASPRRQRALIAVGRARGKILAIGPRLIDGARHGRALQQPRPIITSCDEPLVDGMDPVGEEQRRRRRAIGHRETVAGRPLPALQSIVEPAISDFQSSLGVGHAARVALFLRPQKIAHQLLHGSHHVVVEEAVEVRASSEGTSCGATCSMMMLDSATVVLPSTSTGISPIIAGASDRRNPPPFDHVPFERRSVS